MKGLKKAIILLSIILSCSSPRLGRSSRSSALSRYRSPSSSYATKNTDIHKKYAGSTSPLDSPSLARSRKTSIVDSYLESRERKEKEEIRHDNHEVIDYKELYEKEKQEKEVSLHCAYFLYPQIFLGRKKLVGKMLEQKTTI